MARNIVIAGDYEKKRISISWAGTAYINLAFLDKLYLNKDTIESYEVIDESKRKSVGSAITRGAIGTFFLGPIGLLAAASAKNKGDFLISIQFKDGKRSLLEVEECLYKAIVTKCF